MKTPLRSALSILVVALMSTAVLANDVVVTFDAAGTYGCGPVAAFVPFDLYVVGWGVGEVRGWEIGMEISPLYTVLDRTISNGSIIIAPPEADNYVVGLSGCVGVAGQDYIFVSYRLGYFSGTPSPVDETFCLVPPTAAGASGFLAYHDCSNQIVEMGTFNFGDRPAYDGCAILNGSYCIVPTERKSWGAVKAAY
jgi:hypothetical protein